MYIGERKMRIEIITKNTTQEFKVALNVFNLANKVQFTQTHVTWNVKQNCMQYTAICYYGGK